MDRSTATGDVALCGAAAGDELTKADAFNRRGMARFVQGDLPGALRDFRAALRVRPDYPEAWNNAGVVRQALGEVAGAVDDFSRALAFNPRYAEALNNRARARQALGGVEGALADFERALACAAGRFRATVHHNRGALRQAAGDLPGALADFDRALEIDPEHVATYLPRGLARKEADDLAGALADLDRALATTAPADATPAYHARGGVRALLNDFKGAIADYDEALRIDPTWYVAYVSRGNAYYHRRSRRGLADYFTAYSLNPEGAAREVVRTLADGVRRGADEVLANCDQHLRIDDRDLLAHARRGLTLVLLGREDEAAPHLARFREAATDCTALLESVLAAARNGGEVRATPVSVAVQSDLLFAQGGPAGWWAPNVGTHIMPG
jgi:tetratricopeptide (TPR) repeat protein